MSTSGSPTSPTARRLTGGAILAGGLLGAALFGSVPSASANEDPAANPPNCSAADLEGVKSGVSAATSVYLFTHPDFNYFVTSLEGQSRAQTAAQMKTYLARHPDTKNDITGIRQPLADLKDRCGAPPSP